MKKIIIILLFLLSSHNGWAERITLGNGEVIEGVITLDTDIIIWIESADGQERTIFKDEIQSMGNGLPPPVPVVAEEEKSVLYMQNVKAGADNSSMTSVGFAMLSLATNDLIEPFVEGELADTFDLDSLYMSVNKL